MIAAARAARTLAIASLLTIASTLPLCGQAVGRAFASHTLHFLVTPTDSLRPPLVIDPRRVPMLQRRVSVHLDGLTLWQALKEVSRVSGFDFVYEVKIVSGDDIVHLNASGITVAAVLTDLLSSTDADVLLKSVSTAVLVKRAPAETVAQLLPSDVIVRGHVIGPDSLPLVGAAVTVQAVAERVAKPTRTDVNGAYQVVMPSTAGAYRIVVTLIGYAPQRRELSRQAGNTETIVADFLMVRSVTTLNSVRTTAQRPKPTRDNGGTALGPGDIGTMLDLSNGLSGDFTGDLTMALTMVPGLTVIPDPNGGLPTISAFGLSSDQNNITLNSMEYGGTIPRDGVRVQAITSTYDPSKGGFSGVQQRVMIVSGTRTADRTLHATLSDPLLEWTTPVSMQLGSRYTFPIISGTASGPIGSDRAFYNTIFQFQRRANPLTTLSSASASSLEALGISPDSVARLRSALGPLGIPMQTSGAPSQRTVTSAQLFTRLDFTPNAPPINIINRPGSENVFYLVAGGTWSGTGGAGEGATALPSFGSESHKWTGTLQAVSSRYFWGSVLNEATSAFNAGASHTQPYLTLPSASILLNSTLPDGSAVSSVLQGAGNGSAEFDSRTWSWETKNETSWKTWDNLHTFKITIDGAVDHYAQSQGASFGAYTYNSLADFATGTPASFSRTLTGIINNGWGAHGFVALGDNFRVTPGLFIGYGMRFEGNELGIRPALNPLVDSLFGLRTSHVPNTFTAAPTAGFTWRFGPRGRTQTLLGGIREYRNEFSTASIFPHTRETGLPTGVQQIQCVGSAAAIPDWQSYAQSSENIPSQCADGSSGSTLAQTSPPVLLYAPGYTLPQSWRTNLTWRGPVEWMLQPSLSGTYAINLHQSGIVDANFNPQTRFTLADEANRPVFVDPSSIIPATGAVTYTGSRLFPQLGQVAESETDFRSTTRQISGGITFTPRGAQRTEGLLPQITANYTYNDIRSQTNGFGPSTAGDPRDVSWGPTGFPHHQTQVGGTLRVPDLLTVGASMHTQSGFAYTPRVNGDIMGDGYANDRAFVFNPAITSDATLATGMTNLLNTAPLAARSCLQSQLGTIAGQNSCRGPWTETLNLNASLDAYRLGFKNRGTIQLSVINALGGADYLLHGPNNLRGWGQPAFPDQTLLNVRGFDPATNRFLYTVNPLFGSTTVAHNLLRTPFGIVLDVKLDLGPDRETERIEASLIARATDGVPVLNEGQIATALIGRTPQELDRIIQLRDSLKLSQEQVDTLASMSHQYTTFRESTYTALAKYLASRHGDYHGEEVRTHWHEAVAAVVRRLASFGPPVRALLTPEQNQRRLSRVGGFLDYTDAQLARLLQGPLPPY